jgi:hypothetical protein
LAANGVTTCIVTATKAASSGNGVAISPPTSFRFSAKPLVLKYNTLSVPAGQKIDVSSSGGSGTGKVSYSVISGGDGCDLDSHPSDPSYKTLTSRDVTTCSVVASKDASPGYPLALSEPVVFTFRFVAQPPFVISSIPSTILKVGDKFELSSPGDTYGAVTSYSVLGSGCFITTERVARSGYIYTINKVSSLEPITCVVTGTRGQVGYNSATSPPVNVVFGFYNQLPFSISGAQTALEGQTVSVTSLGGSGTGVVTYSVSGANCSMSGSNLTASAPTSCVVTGTKAAKDGYNAITSQPLTVAFQYVPPVDQQPLTIISPSKKSVRAGEIFSVYTSGGSGTGAVTFTLKGENCFIPSNAGSGSSPSIAVSANQAASCEIIANKAESSGYKPAKSDPVFVDFRIDNQAPISIIGSVQLVMIKGQLERSLGLCSGCGLWLGITGGTGNGLVSYAVSGKSCSISGSYLSASEETTCTVTATKAASVGYSAVSSQPMSYNFKIRDQFKLFISNTVLTQKLPSSFTLSTRTTSFGTGAVSFSTSSEGCSIAGDRLSTTDSSVARTCVVYATKAASTGFYPTTSDPVSFVFVLP